MKGTEGVKAWVLKADADFDDAIAAARRRKPGAADIACFHAQQCVEKYLKAFLVMHRVQFPKTHDLARLVNLAEGADPLVGALNADASSLTDYSVNIRYPGDEATPEEARAALKTMKKIRSFLRKKLGLEK